MLKTLREIEQEFDTEYGEDVIVDKFISDFRCEVIKHIKEHINKRDLFNPSSPKYHYEDGKMDILKEVFDIKKEEIK